MKKQTGLLSYFQSRKNVSSQSQKSNESDNSNACKMDSANQDEKMNTLEIVDSAKNESLRTISIQPWSYISPDMEHPCSDFISHKGEEEHEAQKKRDCNAAPSIYVPLPDVILVAAESNYEESNSAKHSMDDGTNDSIKENDEIQKGDNVCLKPSCITPSSPSKTSSSTTYVTNIIQYQQEEISEYEQLRLRNIQRNLARLESLGLLAKDLNINMSTNYKSHKKKRPWSNTNHTQSQQRDWKRNPDPSSHSTDLSHVRRSSRLQATSSSMTPDTNHHTQLGHTNQELVDKSHGTLDTTKCENYVDSSILNHCDNKTLPSVHSTLTRDILDATDGHEDLITRNTPRLIPPQGLSAIYALDFYLHQPDHKHPSYLVAAGKAGIISIYDIQLQHKNTSSTHHIDDTLHMDPILSWKGHSGRWIADARFIPLNQETIHSNVPSGLLTAANDGVICLWDVRSVSATSGIPKIVVSTGKKFHTSGIFSMHTTSNYGSANDWTLVTGSKDKTVAMVKIETLLHRGVNCVPSFTSNFHQGKVACVQLRGLGTYLLASVSDDGTVATHDSRTNGEQVVAVLENSHRRPHSILWHPYREHEFLTAGYDHVIKIWDHRILSEPCYVLQGHVPLQTKCKQIHRPCYHSRSEQSCTYVLTGSEGSQSVSIFSYEMNSDYMMSLTQKRRQIAYQKRRLPEGCDASCIASAGILTAIATEGDGILLYEPIQQ